MPLVPGSESAPMMKKSVQLTGKLITAEDPLIIGQNFKTLTNMRYGDSSPKTIGGMTKINSTALTTYLKVRNAYHYLKAQPAESHVLAQAWNTGLTASQVIQNTTAIPSAGDFEATSLWTDSSGAGIGRFSGSPTGQLIYCNGVDSCIWYGVEGRCAGFLSFDPSGGFLYDFTDQINNTKDDSANVATLYKVGADATVDVRSTLPLSAVKFYVKTANASAATVTGTTWNGSSWAALTTLVDGTSSGGKTLAQTGTVSFDTTVSVSKPVLIEGIPLYTYRFTFAGIDAGTTVYHCTVGAPFQPIKDLWDGIDREILAFYVTTTSQADKALNVRYDTYSSSDASTYADISNLVFTTQYLEAGFSEPQTAISLNLPPDYVNTDAAAVAAKGTITMTGVATENETFVIGTQTFTWKAARSGVGEVTVGATAAAACTNIVTAVGLDLATVTAALGAPNTVIITAVTAGIVGNTIDFTESSTNMAMDDYGGGHLGGTQAGVDGAGVTSVDYWNGAAWATVGTIIDGTSTAGVPLAKSGVISWNNASLANEQKKQYANGVPLYYYKIKFSSTLDASVRIYYVSGIPAQKVLTGYKFPLYTNDQLFLCANMDGKKNSLITSAIDTTQVFNGQGSNEFDFGDDTELSCGCTLFSQYGSNLFNINMLFKDSEIWGLVFNGTNWTKYRISSAVGGPYPMTLDTVIIPPIKDQSAANRNIAIWMSSDGVYISEGRHPINVSHDIRDLFDQTSAVHINQSYGKSFYGKVDKAKLEYHIFIAVTSGAVTTLDDEWVLDVKRWKWFHIDRDTGKKVQCMISVADTYGTNHAYGFIDTGYMERLEYGNDFDGSDIVSTMETGDFPLIDSNFITETALMAMIPISVAKVTTTADITLTHYIDSEATGEEFTVDPTNSGYRLSFPVKISNSVPGLFHSFKMTITTDSEVCGFEPLLLELFFQSIRTHDYI